ncbi:alanine racemase [Roseivirga sp. BDSF3-8]|uniref:alanine racemase n=1 Tax=Roseivirga sp. BDSF3-8 TaxID=3241598 RepID=UPI0035324158
MISHSRIELSESALRHNIFFVKTQMAPDVQLSAVVKGNAYGHGIEQFVPLAHKAGIRHFSVFSSTEADRVQKSLSTTDYELMIMGQVADEDLPQVIEREMQFYVFDLERLEAALKAAESIGKLARIHLELETGMNRTGLEEANLPAAIDLLDAYREHFILEGFCTHFAGSESISNHTRVADQSAKFRELQEHFQNHGFQAKRVHVGCSATLISYPDFQYNMVRVGILLYGFWPSKETMIRCMVQGRIGQQDPLRRVISWKSYIMTLKRVRFGEFVGYGTAYQAQKDMVIAVIPIGYAYGFSRNFSNQGNALIRGKVTPVLGIVNMNLVMVDVTEVEDAMRGDEVVLIGHQGENSISVASFEQMSNQLNYELLTRLPQELPRVVVE